VANASAQPAKLCRRPPPLAPLLPPPLAVRRTAPVLPVPTDRDLTATAAVVCRRSFVGKLCDRLAAVAPSRPLSDAACTAAATVYEARGSDDLLRRNTRARHTTHRNGNDRRETAIWMVRTRHLRHTTR